MIPAALAGATDIGCVGFVQVATGRIRHGGHPGEGYEPVPGFIDIGQPLQAPDGSLISWAQFTEPAGEPEDLGTMSQTARDFDLAAGATAALDVVGGLAYATTVCMKDGKENRRMREKATARVKEMVGRFVFYVLALQPFALEYREDMTEAELRAWARGVAATLKGDQ